MSEQKVLNAMIEQILAFLPAEQQEKLFALMRDKTVSPSNKQVKVKIALDEALDSVDWEKNEEEIRKLIDQIMPLEILIDQIMPLKTLVPDVYAQSRPVIRDAVIFIGSQLSTKRLVCKLVTQIMLLADMPLEQRLIILISQMPSLQKLGQVIARNQNLNQAFRNQLMGLENSIQDITLAEVYVEIERELARPLKTYDIQIEETILAEASVSAVVRFTWHQKSGKTVLGVFKVLKPYVKSHLQEEITLLQGWINTFEKKHKEYGLPSVGLRELIDNVCRLLMQEIRFDYEQSVIQHVAKCYADMPSVCIPRLIPELCTDSITAMSFHAGVKVTEAFRNNAHQRTILAERLIKALIIVPIFGKEEDSLFHADLHAGNLIVDEKTGDLVILDWAMALPLKREQRRQIVLFTLAIAWRDVEWAYNAIAALSQDNLTLETSKALALRTCLVEFFLNLSSFAPLEFAQVLNLLNQIVLAGITFPIELLMFRKTLFTLKGVLHDIAPHIKIDRVLGEYVFNLMSQEAPQRFVRLPIDISSTVFRSHLSNYDLSMLALTLPLLGQRLCLQTIRQVTNLGLNDVRQSTKPWLPANMVPFFENMTKSGTSGFFEQLKGIKWPRPTIRTTNKSPKK